MSQTAYRLGLDMGANSIGWCAVALGEDGAPGGVLDLGVRILTASEEAGRDPQKGTSLAVDRRVARGLRRRRDRHLLRKSDLMAALIRHRLMPEDEGERRKLEAEDPYEIRAAALDKEVPLHHFGRALFHLHQRRGFRSNRKSDRADEKEAGVIKRGIESLKAKMEAEGARTIGEFLAKRHEKRVPVRARMAGSGKDKEYPFYLERSLVAEEFDRLWDAQSQHHAALTKEARDEIHAILFRQRPLRPVEPGKCSLYPDTEKRAPRALPIAQRFRILKELADLRLQPVGEAARPLTLKERDQVLEPLSTSPKVTFERMRRLLKLDETTRFNFESERRKELKGDESAARLGGKKTLGKAWHALDLATRTEIVKQVRDEQDPDKLARWLGELLPDAEEETRKEVMACTMPEGHSRYGERALTELVAQLENGSKDHVDRETGEVWQRPLQEFEAVEAMGFHHSDRRPTETCRKLPYYGEVLSDAVSGTGEPKHSNEKRFGRLANPTVHIALNQLRHLINAIIAEYGRPAGIAVELARELKQSREQKKEVESQQTENQKANDRRRAMLAELGQPDTGGNLRLLRLYDELPAENKQCVYSGRSIGCRELFSGAVEIDHILPFSRTLDDGFANKVLCFRERNRGKGNRTPAEFFTGSELEEVQERAARLLPAKAWRFAPDAMERFRDDEGMLPRRLTDTQYMARLARDYLQHICPPNKVVATNGRLTAMLRGKWGLNSLLPDHNVPGGSSHPKNRKDHRHHAIDAFVTAVADRGLMQQIARRAGRAEEQEIDKLLEEMPEPWPGFREELKGAVNAVVVSHRPDHGKQGQLHEDTAYGPVTEAERAEGWTLSCYKPVDGLKDTEMKRIRDRKLRARVERVLKAEGEEAARKLLRNDGRRRVKLLKKEDESNLIEIRHGPDRRYRKVYTTGELHHLDIFEMQDGSWDGESVSVYHANKGHHLPDWMKRDDGARLVMRLHKGDLVEVEHKGQRQIMRVRQLQPSADRVQLAGHQEAGALDKRHKENDEIDPFRWIWPKYNGLRKGGARQVRVDLLGRVHAVEYD